MVDMMGSMGNVIDKYVSATVANTNEGGLWVKKELENKPIQLVRAEIHNEKGEIVSSLSCDEDFDVVFTYDVKNKVPGLYCFLGIVRALDDSVVMQSLSNDSGNNLFDSLPLGESQISVHIPKRLVAAGNYAISTSIASNLKTNFFIDKTMRCLRFEINDYQTKRGNTRLGYFSTILDWSKEDI